MAFALLAFSMHDNDDDNDDPNNLGSKSWQEKHSIISATLTESIESTSTYIYVVVEWYVCASMC